MLDLVHRWVAAAPVAASEGLERDQVARIEVTTRSPASFESIRMLEERLGRALPPSYRSFLEITNGTNKMDFLGQQSGFFAAGDVDWVVRVERGLPHLEGPVDDMQWPEFMGGPLDFFATRASHRSYSAPWGHDVACLSVSPLIDGASVWLNPLVQDSDAEWECWDFDVEEQSAYPSFGDFFRSHVERLEREAARVPVTVDLYADGPPTADDLRSVVRRRWHNPVGHLEDTVERRQLPAEMLEEIRAYIAEQRSWGSLNWLRVISADDAIRLGELAWESAESDFEFGTIFQTLAYQSSPTVTDWLASKFTQIESSSQRDACGSYLTPAAALKVCVMEDSQDSRQRLLRKFSLAADERFTSQDDVQRVAREFLSEADNFPPSSQQLREQHLSASVVEGAHIMRRANQLQHAGTGAIRALAGMADEVDVLQQLLASGNLAGPHQNQVAWRLLNLGTEDGYEDLCQIVDLPIAGPNVLGPQTEDLRQRVIDTKLDQTASGHVDIWSLAFIQDQRATRLIVDTFYQDPSKSTSGRLPLATVCRALEIQRTPGAMSALERLTEQGLEPLGCLARLRNDQAIDRLIALLPTTDQPGWIAARLYESGSPKAVQPLVAVALTSSDHFLIDLAAAVTGRHDPTNPYLDHWAENGDIQQSLTSAWRQ